MLRSDALRLLTTESKSVFSDYTTPKQSASTATRIYSSSVSLYEPENIYYR
jgi:hypothetical protein